MPPQHGLGHPQKTCLGPTSHQCSSHGTMARCRGASDILGDHAISCGIGGERIAWHNCQGRSLPNSCAGCRLCWPVKEPAGLLPGSDDRPADVLIPFWTNGQDSTLDVTVINPLQAGLVVRAFQGGQSAVESAHYAGKVRKHEERCPNEHHLHPTGIGNSSGLAPCCPGYHQQAWQSACQECGQGGGKPAFAT